MIARYTRPEMGALWSEDAKYARWLRVELAVCEAWARRGVVPADALDRIRQRARVDAGAHRGDRGRGSGTTSSPSSRTSRARSARTPGSSTWA